MKFTVFMTTTATFGVDVEAATAEEAEAIAERDLYGPKQAEGVDFGTWNIATGATEQWAPTLPAVSDWVPDHIKAKQHHQKTQARNAQATR